MLLLYIFSLAPIRFMVADDASCGRTKCAMMPRKVPGDTADPLGNLWPVPALQRLRPSPQRRPL